MPIRHAPTGHAVRRPRQHGASMIEFAIVAPFAVVVILALIQLGLAMIAKQLLNEAAFEGARLGASEHAQRTEVLRGIERKLLPFYADSTKLGSTDATTQAGALATALGTQTLDVANPLNLSVTLLSPPAAAFTDFGLPVNDGSGNTVQAIPNDNLEFRTYASYRGARSQLTIQDANELRIQVTYALEIKVPLMKYVLKNVMCGTLFGTAGVPAFGNDLIGIPSEATDCVKYWSRGRMPITAYATVQMQSDAWQDASW